MEVLSWEEKRCCNNLWSLNKFHLKHIGKISGRSGRSGQNPSVQSNGRSKYIRSSQPRTTLHMRHTFAMCKMPRLESSLNVSHKSYTNFRRFILNNPLFAWHGKLCCCPQSSTPRHHLPLSAHSDSRSHVTPRGARWRGTPFIRRFGQTGRFNMARLWRTLAPLERNGGNAKKAGVGTVECYQSLALFGPIHDSCRFSE